MKSILQEDNGVCFLCSLAGDDHEQYTQEHHVIYGTSGRKLSEKYGLKLYLCPRHHEFGKEAVHKNKETRILLEKIAQLVFITQYGPELWMQIFGKNYLEPEEKELKLKDAFSAAASLTKGSDQEGGFCVIDDPIGDL